MSSFWLLFAASSSFKLAKPLECNIPNPDSTWTAGTSPDFSGCGSHVHIVKCKFAGLTSPSKSILDFNNLQSATVSDSNVTSLTGSDGAAIMTSGVKQLLLEDTVFEFITWLGVLKSTDSSLQAGTQLWLFDVTVTDIKGTGRHAFDSQFEQTFCDGLTLLNLDVDGVFKIPVVSADVGPVVRRLVAESVKAPWGGITHSTNPGTDAYYVIEGAHFTNVQHDYTTTALLFFMDCKFVQTDSTWTTTGIKVNGDVSVADCTFDGFTATGVLPYGHARAQVCRSTFTKCGIAVDGGPDGYLLVANCQFSHYSTAAVKASTNAPSTIRNCVFSEPDGSGVILDSGGEMILISLCAEYDSPIFKGASLASIADCSFRCAAANAFASGSWGSISSDMAAQFGRTSGCFDERLAAIEASDCTGLNFPPAPSPRASPTMVVPRETSNAEPEDPGTRTEVPVEPPAATPSGVFGGSAVPAFRVTSTLQSSAAFGSDDFPSSGLFTTSGAFARTRNPMSSETFTPSEAVHEQTPRADPLSAEF
jgi:hypothetical protein